MKAKRIITAAAVAFGLFAANAAQANFYFIDNVSPTNTSSIAVSTLNDFRTQLSSAGVSSLRLGRSLGVSGTVGQFVIDVDFFGAEAAYRNQFRLGSTVVVDNTGNRSWSERDRGTYQLNYTGLMNFRFCAVNVNTCYTNSQNDGSSSSSPFQIGMRLTNNNNTAWLLWDDSGAGPDDDHDDLIVRLTYRAVPEPGTLALLGLGLVGVAMFRRKTLKA